MDSAFRQELLKAGIQALTFAVPTLLVGWAILRHQERVKREEELSSSMRRLRVDACKSSLQPVMT